MESLQDLRKQLDEVDREMVRLYEKRMAICAQVGEYKAAMGKEVFDRQREKEKLQAVAGMAETEFNKKGVQKLYQQLMAMSRRLQYQQFGIERCNMRVKELIVYRGIERGNVLEDISFLCDHYDHPDYENEELRLMLYKCINEFLDMAVSYGFEGNLWHTCLAYLLASHENPYSTSCEIVGEVEGSINDAALHDFEILKEMFDYDFSPVEKALETNCLSFTNDYRGVSGYGKVFNKRIRDRICELSRHLAEAEDAKDFKNIMTQFYKEFGVGKLGLHKAFRVEHKGDSVEIVPITKIAHVHLDDLVGYEIAKKKLIDNTEAFVSGRKANNCLLFGDAGTGKSSSIKAILNQYYDRGLRMIEVYKHQFQDLNDIIAQVKNRNYKFIIYMDDLSFEEFEIEYKYLKAVIEGGLERKPDNILIYATSNRRHLVRETFKDKLDRDEELHTNDTVQEKLSLVARFGVTIYFGKPDKKQFQEIVRELAKRNDIQMPEEELLLEANKWELSHGGLSGRTAQQFMDYLAGTR